ncbi:histidine kinase [Paenibacillus sp.]|jgi:two-component system sensor histidine kinase KdpD|uniref:histidine kinase n=1 Tax=Paenibacillus sp. TaxID=58172 RepID=UPI0028300153|nr:histidine kinase [Paenibacillus sp.]MDR0267538.1 histidine kinase [Paenibacillus sp.]
MDGYKRKTPEQVLEDIRKLQRGKLKILIGAVSGSGKTYHMLREGQMLKSRGIDVVVCAVSTRGRPETVKQLADLERVTSIQWVDRGKETKDLNLEGLLARNPEVVLVDGLAHRNRKEACFETRLKDIEFLLVKGISVITTLNVYELEGVQDLVRKWTGMKARETVPVETLEMADEVRLIDVTPETLIARLREGHLRQSTDTGLFTRKDLAVLRELSLRLVAEDVNSTLERYRDQLGLQGPSGASERILVSAQYHWNGSIYIRGGQQITKRLNGELLVVVFIAEKEKLTKEGEAFKRSLYKMAKKTDASIEELSLRSTRKFTGELIRYAMDKKVTRIVLGHSKKSRWQEFWQGSVTDGILKRAEGLDIFWVADRTAHGEPRILPVRRRSGDHDDRYHRLSKEEMDKKVERMKRGRFKIYIGAAPGVGKTYTMLQEGNESLRKGVDVVIGWLETHGRAETAAQVDHLEMVPALQIPYKGTILREMDFGAILERNPELVLVDELPHSNVPGSLRQKRYEDIVALLEHGISVITTVNIQHLESLNDAVEQMTGIRVRETVPDYILSMADEVELIDVTPQSLQQRMREGKIYATDKIEQALGSFFKTGNLIALREMALREIADDVDERLEAWERQFSLRGPWRREEAIYVCILPGSSGERLIRRGFRIAYRLKAELHVNYILLGPVPGEEMMSSKVEACRKLTESFGGIFEETSAITWKEIPRLAMDKANLVKATQIIIGQAMPDGQTQRRRSSVRELIRLARDLDVLLVSNPESVT